MTLYYTIRPEWFGYQESLELSERYLMGKLIFIPPEEISHYDDHLLLTIF